MQFTGMFCPQSNHGYDDLDDALGCCGSVVSSVSDWEEDVGGHGHHHVGGVWRRRKRRKRVTVPFDEQVQSPFKRTKCEDWRLSSSTYPFLSQSARILYEYNLAFFAATSSSSSRKEGSSVAFPCFSYRGASGFDFSRSLGRKKRGRQSCLKRIRVGIAILKKFNNRDS